MKFIIIGINGMAGSAFSRVLPELGHECIGITRSNYDDLKGYEADVLVNANGSSSKPQAEADPQGEIERVVSSTMRFCNDFTFKTFVHISSGDVYSNLDNPELNSEETTIDVDRLSSYGLCKHMAESVVRNRCSRWLIMRAGGLIGPGLRKNAVFDLLTGDKLYLHPDSRIGFIHTDAVVRATCSLIDQQISNEIFNIAGKGLISIRDIMEMTGNTNPHYSHDCPTLHYELSNNKIDNFYNMPYSKQTVRDFIEWWKSENNNA